MEWNPPFCREAPGSHSTSQGGRARPEFCPPKNDNKRLRRQIQATQELCLSASVPLSATCWPMQASPPSMPWIRGAASSSRAQFCRMSKVIKSSISSQDKHLSSCARRIVSCAVLAFPPGFRKTTTAGLSSDANQLSSEPCTAMAAERNILSRKLVLLGDTAVGKSCLAVRFVRDEVRRLEAASVQCSPRPSAYTAQKLTFMFAVL